MSKPRVLITALLVLVLTSCGGNAQPTRTPGPTATFFPTYSFVQPTEAPSIVTIGAETATAAVNVVLDPEKVAQGKGRYDALKCGDCHGDHGQGTPKGSTLVG